MNTGDGQTTDQISARNADSAQKILRPVIVDTTLREGEQTPGLAFSVEEKVSLARRLVEAGVTELEIGTPVMGGSEARAVREILALGLPATLRTWNRALREDIDASLACGVQHIYVSIPVSDTQISSVPGRTRHDVLDQLRVAIQYGIDRGCDVVCGLQDATRADRDFLLHVVRTAKQYGASRVRPSDTVGILTPEKTAKLFEFLGTHVDIELESHCHNDFGLATANTLAAWNGGARYLDATIMGLGERAGNAPMEEVTMAMERLHEQPTGIDTRQLKPLALEVSTMAGRAIPESRPVVGDGIFTHESGVHVAGVLKNPSNYEPYRPEDVGAERKIILGKHSGKKAVMLKLSELGLSATAQQAGEILEEVRRLSGLRKGTLTDSELQGIIRKTMGQKPANNQRCSLG